MTNSPHVVVDRGWRRVRQLPYRAFGALPLLVRRAVARVLTPRWMVGAMVLVERGDKILLVRPVYRGGWTLPGGVVDRGESPLDGGVREVREEVGLEVKATGTTTVVVDVEARRIDMILVAEVVEPEAEPSPASAEIGAVGWFGREALPPLVFEARTALAALAEPERNPWVLPPGQRSDWMD